MRVISAPPSQPPAAVYLLLRRDRQRFKVGWAADPMRRIRKLPEFVALQLDIAASKVLWLPDRQRAEQVERAVQKTLAPHTADAGHRRDGHSEWFEQLALPLAVRALVQMPAKDRAIRVARLISVQAKPPALDAEPIETGPLDTWWALEDLWSRLAMHGHVSVDMRGDVHGVVIHDFRNAWDGPVGDLRSEVMDLGTYRWHTAGRSDEFVKLIDYRGDDLVCTLAMMRLIATWPEGDDLIWQVKGFLLRLRRQGEASRPCRLAGQID